MSHLKNAISITALVLASSSANSQDVLVIRDFDDLPLEQQMQIFSASYRAALVTLAFDNIAPAGSLAESNRFGSCLIDRDEQWVAKTYFEYKATRPLQPQESVGAVVAKALAWKCGIFPTK